MHDLQAFSQFASTPEYLWVATDALETMEDSFLCKGDKSSKNTTYADCFPNVQ